MIFCFSGTGNSRYIARRFAEALQDTIIDLNAKIKAQDNSLIQTGQDVIIVVPTYAWRIPRVVSEWLTKTQLTSAERIWFVMDCGSEIGNAAKYNRQLAAQLRLIYMGTAQVVMPENYIAMFGVPKADEAVKIVEKANPDIENAIARVKERQKFPIPRNNLYDRIKSGLVNPIFYQLIVKADLFNASEACIGCGQCIQRCPTNNITLENGKPARKWQTCLEQKLHALHGLHLLLPHRGDRIRQKKPWQATLSLRGTLRKQSFLSSLSCITTFPYA